MLSLGAVIIAQETRTAPVKAPVHNHGLLSSPVSFISFLKTQATPIWAEENRWMLEYG